MYNYAYVTIRRIKKNTEYFFQCFLFFFLTRVATFLTSVAHPMSWGSHLAHMAGSW